MEKPTTTALQPGEIPPEGGLKGELLDTQVPTIKSCEKRVYALHLRKAGWSERQIAVSLEESVSTIRRWLRQDLRRTAKALFKAAKELIALESLRLDDLTKAIWDKCQDSESPYQARAMEVMLKLMDRRAKLLGLDQPDKIEQKIDAKLSTLSDNELMQQAEDAGINVDVADPVEVDYHLPEQIEGLAEDGSETTQQAGCIEGKQ